MHLGIMWNFALECWLSHLRDAGLRRKNPRAGLGGCTRLKQGGWGGKKALSQLSHPGGSPWLSSGWSTPQQQNNDWVPEQAAGAD